MNLNSNNNIKEKYWVKGDEMKYDICYFVT